MARRATRSDSTINYSELDRDAHKRFGVLLHELCEVSGLTQGKLARQAKFERSQLVKSGCLELGTLTGSMEQPTISRVLAGLQEPTYFQVLIWLRVIRKYYESDDLTRICEERGIIKPAFTAETERLLWTLASFVPPDERARAFAQSKNFQLLGFHIPIIEHKERRMLTEVSNG
jgi:hypothetical protein